MVVLVMFVRSLYDPDGLLRTFLDSGGLNLEINRVWLFSVEAHAAAPTVRAFTSTAFP
jgi:hypothetical protein